MSTIRPLYNLLPTYQSVDRSGVHRAAIQVVGTTALLLDSCSNAPVDLKIKYLHRIFLWQTRTQNRDTILLTPPCYIRSRLLRAVVALNGLAEKKPTYLKMISFLIWISTKGCQSFPQIQLKNRPSDGLLDKEVSWMILWVATSYAVIFLKLNKFLSLTPNQKFLISEMAGKMKE